MLPQWTNIVVYCNALLKYKTNTVTCCDRMATCCSLSWSGAFNKHAMSPGLWHWLETKWSQAGHFGLRVGGLACFHSDRLTCTWQKNMSYFYYHLSWCLFSVLCCLTFLCCFSLWFIQMMWILQNTYHLCHWSCCQVRGKCGLIECSFDQEHRNDFMHMEWGWPLRSLKSPPLGQARKSGELCSCDHQSNLEH